MRILVKVTIRPFYETKEYLGGNNTHKMISYTNTLLDTILPWMTIKRHPVNTVYAKLPFGCCTIESFLKLRFKIVHYNLRKIASGSKVASQH